MIEFRDVLGRLIAGEDLMGQEVEELFGRLMDGDLSVFEKTALLVGLACKGETPEEIAGAARAMRERLLGVHHGQPDAVDTCGTGGDGKGTINVSTGAALCAAAAGVPIAKHGNRSVSSLSGSADVLSELGLELEQTSGLMGRCLDEVGLAFLFAPLLHPAMREVMPVRQALGVRTVFNVLGPLTNPAGSRRQVMGVYSPKLVRPIADVLRRLGAEHALVVHGADGLDEISTTGPTAVAELRGSEVREVEIEPESLGLPRRSMADLLGGGPRDNAALLRDVLEGQGRPAHREIIAINAAAAIYVGGGADDLAQGLEKAFATLDSGAGAAKLEELVSYVKSAAPAETAAGEAP